MSFQDYLQQKRELYHNHIERTVKAHKLSEPMRDVLKITHVHPGLWHGRKSWMLDSTLKALAKRGLIEFKAGKFSSPTKIANYFRLTETGQEAVAKLHFEGYAPYIDAQIRAHKRVVELKERLEGVFAEFAEDLPQKLVHRTMQAYPAGWSEDRQQQIMEAK